MLENIDNKFIYEGIVSEQKGNRLCLKYKDWEAIEKNSRWISFFSSFRQKGIIKLDDDDIENLIPYSMEGKKCRVTIELIRD